MFSDTYLTIASPTESSFRDRGSKFLGYAFPVKNEGEVREHLQQLRKQYHDATHVCHAYILGATRNISHSSDDGEPNNTAGKPIQRAIMGSGITNVAVFVVRYYGGTQLGVPGLINAYHTCAADALKMATIVEETLEETYLVICGYEHENEVFKMLRQEGAGTGQIIKDERLHITFAIRRSKADQLCNQLKKIPQLQLTFVGSM